MSHIEPNLSLIIKHISDNILNVIIIALFLLPLGIQGRFILFRIIIMRVLYYAQVYIVVIYIAGVCWSL